MVYLYDDDSVWFKTGLSQKGRERSDEGIGYVHLTEMSKSHKGMIASIIHVATAQDRQPNYHVKGAIMQKLIQSRMERLKLVKKSDLIRVKKRKTRVGEDGDFNLFSVE